MDRLLTQAHRKALLLGAIGGEIRNVGGKAYVPIALIVVVAEVFKIILKVQGRSELAGTIKPTALKIPFIAFLFFGTRTPLAAIGAHNTDCPSSYRLSKQITGRHVQVQQLPRQVVRLVGYRIDRKLRQLIAADADLRRRSRRSLPVHFNLDQIAS